MDITVDYIKPWASLYLHYKGIKYSSAEEDRKFKAWTGVAPQVAEIIFRKYHDDEGLPDRSRLLIVLNFLKVMPTEDEGASSFKLNSRKTYRNYLWKAVEYLDNNMTEIDINDRFHPTIPNSGIFENVSLIVDGTDCSIDRPSELCNRLKYSNGRSKENTHGRYNLKYTIACQIISGKICAVLGPEPGRVADIEGLRRGERLLMLESKEILLADKGYQGHGQCLTPFKGTGIAPEEEAFNEVLASVRILVECVINRVKIFGAIGSRGRFHCCISKHPKIFNLACQITNISLDRNPVWLKPNWYLSQTSSSS
jgi:hypothetical protein